MFNLSQEEKQAVIFLLIISSFGLGINYFTKTNCKIKIFPVFSQNVGKINLNLADKAALLGIKGVGEKIAEQILAYRQANRGFNSLEELKNIKNMTVKRFEKIKNYFYLE